MNARKKFDVACIGAGPAGLATALWSRELGLSAVVFERAVDPGGQLKIIHNKIASYPGIAAADGHELRDNFLSQLSDLQIEIRSNSNVVSVSVGLPAVVLEDQSEIHARDIIVATGVRRRQLGVPGEREFFGKGILASGAASRETVAGQNVVVIGGGDAAVENALILSEGAERVTLIHRKAALRARAEFARQVHENDKINLLLNTTVSEIFGTDQAEGVRIAASDGATKTISADSILIRIGWEPNSEIVSGLVRLDEAGYIITDETCATSAEGIYAIGDVRRPLTPTIAGAVGDAATAVKIIANNLKLR